MSKGICFIEPLFNKVVIGGKTQTRRIMNPQPVIKNDRGIKKIEGWRNATHAVIEKVGFSPYRFEIHQLLRPKYKVGEVVYLKEPYQDAPNYHLRHEVPSLDPYGTGYIYKFSASKQMISEWPKWLNKLFMPESAARYFIKITAVRAERLQDISEEDCLKEGIEKMIFKGKVLGLETEQYFNGYEFFDTPIEAYSDLIDRINGEDTWEKNPCVWVYDFELIKN